MKQFFKMMFASAFGTFLAFGLIFFFVISMMAALVRFGFDRGPVPTLEQDSVLQLQLEGDIPEKTSRFDFDWLERMQDPSGSPHLGLLEIKQVLEAAQEEDKIDGLYIVFRPFSAGWATLESIKKSMKSFRDKGKFIIAYGEIYSEKAMYLASEADEAFAYPLGFYELNGLGSNPIFLKETLEKLNVEPVVFKVGKYKSAVETFSRTSLSDDAKKQLQEYLDFTWNHVLTEVEKGTKASVEQLNQWASNLTIATTEEAAQHKLVKLSDESSIYDLLKEKSGGKTEDDLPKFVGFGEYHRLINQPEPFSTDPNLIALLYVTGEIVDGRSAGGVTGSQTIVDAIHKIKKDDRVKAVILRVNSPGGSALASDVIMNELNSLDKEIPVVASFGDVAASGGYYVAAQTDYIFAHPTTLTGSIGVFGVILNTKDFFNQKLGVHFGRVVTNPYADTGSPARNLTELEVQRTSSVINHIYERFLDVVLDGRKFESRDAVHAVAQGRVWVGAKAKEVGLVNELGGLDEALDKAAELAKIEDYMIQTYPRERNPLEEFFGSVQADLKMWLAKEWLSTQELQLFRRIEQAKKQRGVLMRMPFDLELN